MCRWQIQFKGRSRGDAVYLSGKIDLVEAVERVGMGADAFRKKL